MIININNIHHIHEMNHDPLMIAHQTSVCLLIVNEQQTASFSKQWPESIEGGRVLSWKTVEELAVVRCDTTVVLSGESVSSTFTWDPVWVSKQWPELFESGRVQSWEAVTGLTIIEWDVASIVRAIVLFEIV